MSEVWETLGSAFVNMLRDRGLSGVQRLRNVSWDVGVHVASDVASKQKEPRGYLHLHLETPISSNSTEASSNSKIQSSETVSMELSKEELEELFDHIETIQEQIDALTT